MYWGTSFFLVVNQNWSLSFLMLRFLIGHGRVYTHTHTHTHAHMQLDTGRRVVSLFTWFVCVFTDALRSVYVCLRLNASLSLASLSLALSLFEPACACLSAPNTFIPVVLYGQHTPTRSNDRWRARAKLMIILTTFARCKIHPVSVSIYVFPCVFPCVFSCVLMWECVSVHVYVCVFVCVWNCVCVCVHSCWCMRVSVSACFFVCLTQNVQRVRMLVLLHKVVLTTQHLLPPPFLLPLLPYLQQRPKQHPAQPWDQERVACGQDCAATRPLSPWCRAVHAHASEYTGACTKAYHL